MIAMTSQAHAVVRRVTSHPRVGRRSGLRIAARGRHVDKLGVAAVAGPEPGDRVIERDGARIYLDRTAVPRVNGRLLDVRTEDTGRVQFVVKEHR